MKHQIKILLLAAVFTGTSLFSSILQIPSASALSGSQFKAGRIIDDSLFYNGETMTASQIQQFLDAKVPTCDTNGTKIFSGTTTRAEYGASRGYPAPYTCLKSFKQNTPYRAGESGLCSAISAKSGRTAAQIIDDVARSCHISQKALIVMLQKEQALITDDWPWSIQYRSAMGYGCPDGGAVCDSEYYGFFNQVYNAARQFQRYKADPNNWNHVPNMNNSILYQADMPSCGSATVYIENFATAGLYNYTPYTPNKAALDDLYGGGDDCSAYGNRNFWRYYNDWFGSTQGTPFFSISGSGKVYIRAANDGYYYIPTLGLLRDYGMDTKFKKIDTISQTAASSLTPLGVLPSYASFEGSEIYAVSNSKISHFTSRTMLENHYGLDITKVAQLPQSLKQHYPLNGAVNQVMTLSDGSPIYFIEQGKKRHISSSTAYSSLGSPIYAKSPQVILSSTFANRLTDGAPIVIPNTVLKARDTSKYFYWDGSKLYSLSQDAYTNLSNGYSTTDNLIRQLSASLTGIQTVVIAENSQHYALIKGTAARISSAKANSIITATSTTATQVPDAFLSKYKTYDSTAKFIVFNQAQTIYYNDGYKLYQVYDRNTLYGLGGSFTSVVSLPGTMEPRLYDKRGYRLLSNQLFQINGNGKVYVSGSDFNAYHVLSTDIARQYGMNLNNIAKLPSSTSVQDYSLQTLRRYAKDSLGRIWLIDRSSRMELNTANLSEIGVDPSTVSAVSDPIVNRLPIKKFSVYAADVSTGKVYLLEDGQKRWFKSRRAVEARTNWSEIVDYSSEFIATLPEGTPIN